MGSGFAAAKAFIPPNQNKMERAQPRMLHPAGVGSLTSSLPAPGLPAPPAAPGITRTETGPGGLGCPGGFAGGFEGKIWGHGGHRVSARHGMGLGSAPCSAAGRSGGHMFGCFPASVRTSIFSSLSCKGSRFGAFPARWLGRGMPCAWTGAPRCCSQ